jgi:hypothetical protein
MKESFLIFIVCNQIMQYILSINLKNTHTQREREKEKEKEGGA